LKIAACKLQFVIIPNNKRVQGMRFAFTCSTDLRHDLDLDFRGADAGEHCTRATADLLLNADRSSRDLQFFSSALSPTSTLGIFGQSLF
jgi:hypothetical protein